MKSGRAQNASYAKLLEEARGAQRFSYSPYSKFRVGAAVLARDGAIFTGTNVENTSYGLTICAERVAVFNAISHGSDEIVAVAVACGSGGSFFPCGACRQVLFELARNADVITEGRDGTLDVKSVAELLPKAFGPSDLTRPRP